MSLEACLILKLKLRLVRIFFGWKKDRISYTYIYKKRKKKKGESEQLNLWLSYNLNFKLFLQKFILMRREWLNYRGVDIYNSETLNMIVRRQKFKSSPLITGSILMVIHVKRFDIYDLQISFYFVGFFFNKSHKNRMEDLCLHHLISKGKLFFLLKLGNCLYILYICSIISHLNFKSGSSISFFDG